MKPIVLSRKLAIGIITVAVCATLVSGVILSNYLVPSTVNITSMPGIVVLDATAATPACTTSAVTTHAWGDVQQGQSKSTFSVCIKNSQGSATQYLLPSSLTTQAPLPSGVTLTWNFPTSPINCGAGVTTPCIALLPTQSSPPLTLTLSASTSATAGSVSFTEVYQSYSTATG
jgi:hypothetical protein